MGIIHVLTGPDHLSALATLSGTNIHRHTRFDSFFLGVKWGIGHSFGLLLVGGILISMEETSGDWIGMDSTLSTILEGFVGVFMLALGAYGLFKADQNNRDDEMQNASLHPPNASQLLCSKELSDAEKDDMVECISMGIVKEGDEDEEAVNLHGSLVTKMTQVLMKDESDRSDSNQYGGDAWSRRSYGELSCSDYMDDNRTLGSMVTVNMKPRDEVDNSSPTTGLSVENVLSNNANTYKTNSYGAYKTPLSRIDSERIQSMEIDLNDSCRGEQSTACTPKVGNRRPGQPTITSATSLVSKHTNHIQRRSSGGMGTILNCRDGIFSCCHGVTSKFFFISPGAMAIVAGIIHGVAGPGGVLGVIPAIELKDAKLAIMYLGTFCVTSTFVMGGFAAFLWIIERMDGRGQKPKSWIKIKSPHG